MLGIKVTVKKTGKTGSCVSPGVVLAQLGSQEVIHWNWGVHYNFKRGISMRLILVAPLHPGHLAVEEGAGEMLSLPLLPPLLPVSGLPWLKTPL